MVPSGRLVPHQLFAAMTPIPASSRLLPVVPAEFPPMRLKLTVTDPDPLAPAAIPPPPPVAWLPVIVTFESAADVPAIGFSDNPPPFSAPGAFVPLSLPEITVP